MCRKRVALPVVIAVVPSSGPQTGAHLLRVHAQAAAAGKCCGAQCPTQAQLQSSADMMIRSMVARCQRYRR